MAQETASPKRTINRGANPFAPMIKLRNKALTSDTNKYETLLDRIKPAMDHPQVLSAVADVRERLKGQVWKQEHFGTLEWLNPDLIDLNVDIQRLLETPHVADNIMRLYEPRVAQPVNVIHIKETGRYSAWEGQQSSCAFALLQDAGLIEPGTKLQCKVVADDLVVPGSDSMGEAVANFGFRCLNFKGRKTPDQYYLYRSMVNGVRLYNSQLREDQQAAEIQNTLERNHMFPAPKFEAQGRKATPGMVTYLSGVLGIAGHDTAQENFEVTVKDLDWALRWHDTYFPHEKGVDGGFILAFGRLAAEAREAGIVFDKETEDDLARHVRTRYGTPAGLDDSCKERLKKWQVANNLKDSWSDSCLTPILVADYINYGGQCNLPMVKGMVTYAGV